MHAQVVSFKCTVKNKAGQFISSTFNQGVLTMSEVPPGGVLYGLNKNMQNLTKGEKRTISVSAEEAYGLYDPQKVILFPRKKLPFNAKIGESVTIVSKTGVHRSYQVIEFYAGLVKLDGNHPLAGQDLIFEIETIQAREATRQEIDGSINTVSHQALH